MIRLGLRLTFKGGREAAVRLILTALAAALGVAMLLITVAGINAVNAQNARYAWLETGHGPRPPATASSTDADPAWWLLTADMFDGKIIGRVDVAATGPRSPVPPGLDRLPAPGQVYASPALRALLRSSPAAQLHDRYPGTVVGTIGAAALPAPDSLIAVVGRTVEQLSHVKGAEEVTRISTVVPSSCNGPECFAVGIDANGIDLVLAIAAAALLFPVLIFIGTTARLSAARREQRFAAMRLVGATPRQVSVVAAVESTVAALPGVALGFGLFFALRPPLARIPFTGARFFLGDLSLRPVDIAVVAVGVPIAAAVAARLALRRVQISPLGVTRRVTPTAPRAWRVLPVLAGLGELYYFVVNGRPATTPGQILAYLSGILVVMVGLVMAGPWLTMMGGRVLARGTRRPSALIAGRRLSDDPKAGFRAVSGLVLALFVASISIGIITTINAYDTGSVAGPHAGAILVDDFVDFSPGGITALSSLPAETSARLRAVPGVRALAEVHRVADPRPQVQIQIRGKGQRREIDRTGQRETVIACTELDRIPSLGRCPVGAVSAWIPTDFGGRTSTRAPVLPAADLSRDEVAALPVALLAVDTDGSRAAIEQTRTVLEAAYPYAYNPMTISEETAQRVSSRLTDQYQRLANVAILASMIIAGCSLAVSVAGGLTERKRPFSLLRLTGAPLGLLRRVVGLESALPLLAIAALTTGVGFLAARLFLTSQLDERLRAPGVGYYLVVGAGLVASLGVIASTLPLLRRITGPETARND